MLKGTHLWHLYEQFLIFHQQSLREEAEAVTCQGKPLAAPPKSNWLRKRAKVGRTIDHHLQAVDP